MTDTNFLKGLTTGISGIGSGANGITSAVKNIALLPYLQAQVQQRAKSQAAIQAYNEARTRDLNEAATRRAEVANALRENPNPMAKYLIAADFSNGDNLMRGIKTAQNAAILQKLIDTAGLSDTQPDATSLGGTAEQPPPPDLNEMLTRTAQIQTAIKGKAPYTKGQYGTILNAITGVLHTADPEARQAQLAKDRTAATRNQAQAEKARKTGKAPTGRKSRAGGRTTHRTRSTAGGGNASLRAEAMKAIANGADRATIAERYRQLTGEHL